LKVHILSECYEFLMCKGMSDLQLPHPVCKTFYCAVASVSHIPEYCDTASGQWQA